ncbi:hypothetical protein HK407_03g05400 [Ordospora pajunii]|jgi:hypothetical protein|uniref:uncharacterized protein n=1 Tax=Ordospora pajunii TaxID=3039483 RepID=UPI0029527F37|nr:uncharacterized protein HK407_03g05400 [Ordospora pajunii]KAH9411790.1 hypothetical protein HK407_03g05400 [Ordospora pajunii]
MSIRDSTKAKALANHNVLNDASLFVHFVDAIHSAYKPCNKISSGTPNHHLRQQAQEKACAKTYYAKPESNRILHSNHSMPFTEDTNGFVCAFCNARYIYKRCLITHLMKTHNIDLKNPRRPFHLQ